MSQELYLLVKSLTKAEKGYFKKFAQRYSTEKDDNQYLALLDAIDEQPAGGEYDEAKMIKKHNGKKFIKHLSTTKKYLLNALLKALRSYREGSQNALTEINELIENAQICFDKQLMSLGNKFLDKARQIALQEELFLKVADIAYLRYRQVEFYVGEERQIFWQQLYAETCKMLHQHQNIADMIDLNITATQQQGQNRALRSEAEIAHLEDLLQHPLLMSENQAASYSAKAHYYNTLFMLHYWLGNTEAAMTQLTALLTMMEKLPYGNIKAPAVYMPVLVNYLTFCFQLNNFEYFNHYLDCLQAIPVNTPTAIAMKFERYYGMAIRYAYHIGDKMQGQTLINQYQAELNIQHPHLNMRRRITTYGTIVAFYLKTKQFNFALDWIARYENELDTNLTPDMTAFMKLYYLLCHYELHNTEHLAYAIRNTHNQLKNNHRLYDLERTLLQFFKRELKSITPADTQNNLQLLYGQLNDWLQNPLQNRVLTAYFDFLGWVNLKLDDASKHLSSGKR
ncbi:MAG: hypothetical protein IPI59_08885 [Sphingobacteriales bacterium]|jgi:hypothetical protein|nr:hypothetical protein [Sphingobacteriales bacterium]MBP9142097.1 hypothetical protein [Chitinophagales bacterium]MDA0199034.1 hypothetical protein [Bacteroidota bacterium]MBK6889835.1 hypothetical protein [Sphingobacteriales bacterium]MBK7527647.1 hypothetical protein [Sphingobacteriales bacterium]